MKTKIILVDDHPVFREGLRSMLQEQADIEVSGEAENGFDAIQLAKDLDPDIVVMDISMPDIDGITAAEQILTHKPSCKILALSMHADAQFMQKMFSVGAKGYLPKNCCFEELTTAIRTLMDAKEYVSPSLNSILLSNYISLLNQQNDVMDNPLSDREVEVLKIIAEGVPTKQIADVLCISVKTVETHRRQIMDKLDINSVAGLTRYAIRVGLIEP